MGNFVLQFCMMEFWHKMVCFLKYYKFVMTSVFVAKKSMHLAVNYGMFSMAYPSHRMVSSTLYYYKINSYCVWNKEYLKTMNVVCAESGYL